MRCKEVSVGLPPLHRKIGLVRLYSASGAMAPYRLVWGLVR